MATIKVTGLTEHFSLSDYTINQTGTIPLSDEAILQAAMLEEFRRWLGRPMEVHAWYRTAAYNKSVGGTWNAGDLAGVFYCSVYDSATDSYANVGSRQILQQFCPNFLEWGLVHGLHPLVRHLLRVLY